MLIPDERPDNTRNGGKQPTDMVYAVDITKW